MSNHVLKYFDELKSAMNWLAEQPNTVFIGQAVGEKGTAMSNTLVDVPEEKKIELPVFEDTQMGMSIGMSLNGIVPISVFPRWNFMLLAINQLVNHLDRYPIMSEYRPKVLIRVGIGSERPLHPNFQHVGDFTDAVKSMLKTVDVVKLEEPDQIVPAYRAAYHSDCSTILVEVADYYNEK